MTRFLIILILSTLPSGCIHYMGLDDLPKAALRPVITGPFIANAGVDNAGYWRAEVQAAADAWNLALEERGCAPAFRVTTNPADLAYEVVLWASDEWPHDDEHVGRMQSGEVGTGFIHVRNRRPRSNLPILVHEMGHALGLSFGGNDDDHRHAPPGADSVMTFKVSDLVAPTARDIAALECL